MTKLLQRLSDPVKSGVYRAAHDLDIRAAAEGTAHDLADITLARGKSEILARIAKALGFPDWFGGNWDALEDSLTDLSWRQGWARIFLFEGARDSAADNDLGILIDVLSSAAEFWREQGRPFFAVFIDPENRLKLPDLYRAKSR